MLGMDFLGPISPRCELTGCKYVLIIVNYFSRFVWAKGCYAADQPAVYFYWINELAPVFGFPKCIYNDNGSHFTGSEITTLFQSHGTFQIITPISHPSSVGLVERNVQLFTSQLRKWVLDRGPAAKMFWGRAIPEIMPAINSRLVRLHGFTPANILLGYSPEWKVTRDRPPGEERNLSAPDALDEVLTTQWMDLRDESRNTATQRMSQNNTTVEHKPKAMWEQPRVGDLVLVRDFTRDKAHGRKLDPRWVGPRLLVEISDSGVSGYFQELYAETTKRYHLDDLKTYCPREEGVIVATSMHRSAMVHAGFPGQKAILLDKLFH